MSDTTPGFIFSTITAIGVIYAILKGVESSRKDRNQDFANMLANFEKDLTEKLKDEKELETGKSPDEDKCDRFSSDYLNILDRVAYLRRKK